MSSSRPNHQAPRKQVWLAVLLSFLFPGIGQLYNEQTAKGLLILLLYVAFWLASIITCGLTLILILPLWIVAIVDAALISGKINRGASVGEWDFF